jgi:Domain of unknown function (DUF6916)
MMSEHEVSRRAFVRGAAGVLVGGLAVTSGLNPLAGWQVATAAPVLGRTTFDKCVGQSFKLNADAVRSLTLFNVRALRFGQPEAQPPAGQDSFSLLFRGPADQPLAQGVYTLDHRSTGKFTVLLAPMRPEPDARYYEVIYNRASPR